MDTVPQSIISPAVWQFALEDALVLARPQVELLFALNPTAKFLWSEFGLQNSGLLAANFLSDSFKIPLGQAQADACTAFLTFSEFVSLETPKPLSTVPEPPKAAFFSANYRVQNTNFRLNLSSPDLKQEIAPRLISLQIRDVSPQHTLSLQQEFDGVSLFRNGVRFAKESLVTAARALLLQELARLAVPNRDFKAIIHAGAAGTPNSCIILAGPSFCGKSTLCSALMEAGLLCYSDDSACLTSDFQVAGMPFALALREGQRFRPSNLNGTSATVPPVALVFVNYQPGAPVVLEPLSAFGAFLELQQSGFWVEHTESSIGSFLRWLSSIPTYRLTYSTLSDGVSTVTALL